MAAFGAPVAQEDHAERALNAALWMQQRLDDVFGGQLALRVGVTTGELIVGRPRHGSSFASGDAVNVAARLEQAAAPGTILVGLRTAALGAGAFEMGPVERFAAKGKPEGIEARRLLRALSLTRPRGEGLRRAFVGRDAELSALRTAFERASNSPRPRLVTVIAEPGVGKTRLVRELWEWIGTETPGAARRIGRCPPFGRAHAYRPVGDVLAEQYGLRVDEPAERVLEVLEERRILALALGHDVSDGQHPLEVRDRFHAAWLDLLRELAAAGPVALLVEDLHWAEDPLLELLERTLAEGPGRLLLIVTGRPEFIARRPGWGAPAPDAERLSLEPLAPAEARRLVDVALGATLPDAIHDVLGRAEGNPLFIEELLAALADRGVIGREGEVRLDRLTDVALPDSVQGLLASRIDRLGPDDKAALQAAAVIGRGFSAEAVAAVAGREPDFGVLEQRDFIRRLPDEAAPGSYTFKHTLTREVAYGSLTRRARARIHAGYGEWLEARNGGRDEDASVLAHHLAEAVRPEDADLAWDDDAAWHAALRGKAVRWLHRAATLATRRYEIAEATGLLDRALRLEERVEEKIGILRYKASIQAIGFDIVGFRRTQEAALDLGPAAEEAAHIYGMLAYYALGRPYMWRRPPPHDLAESWLERALELSTPGSEARGYARLAQALWEPVGNEGSADEACAIGAAADDPGLVLGGLEARTLCSTLAHRYADACEWADRAVEAAAGIRDPSFAGHQYWNAAFVYLRAGRFGHVKPLAEAFARTAALLGPHEAVHQVALRVLWAYASCAWGELERLAPDAEEAAAANTVFPCQFNWRTLLMCAFGLAQRGAEVDARRLEALGRQSAAVAGPPEREAALLRLALLRGDLAEARRIVDLPPAAGSWVVDTPAARLDAIAALGQRDRAEEEAAPYLREPSYTHPFALRALGVVRDDPSLLEAAARAFAAMDLGWRADETRLLAAGVT